ncbi:MAG: hypothetical protein [Cressdnaviricota sp.]|nr:MAG: hypothetical protein [Cressdnaviricota sp.]
MEPLAILDGGLQTSSMTATLCALLFRTAETTDRSIILTSLLTLYSLVCVWWTVRTSHCGGVARGIAQSRTPCSTLQVPHSCHTPAPYRGTPMVQLTLTGFMSGSCMRSRPEEPLS